MMSWMVYQQIQSQPLTPHLFDFLDNRMEWFQLQQYFKQCWFLAECCKERCRDIFKVFQWGIYSTNKFFRLIYGENKLWLNREETHAAVKHGWAILAPRMHMLV